MRKVFFDAFKHLEDTRDEPWIMAREPGHYSNFADFALEGLGMGPGQCLVVGSPLFEVFELQKNGWDVTYVDVRKPPVLRFNFIQGDASEVVLPKDFDCVSSTCVLCHVGLGRYGDPILEGADARMMKNIHGALKKGGLAAICVGTVAAIEQTVEVGKAWRVWNLDGARALVKDFKILREKVYSIGTGAWKNGKISKPLNDDYLCFLLKK